MPPRTLLCVALPHSARRFNVAYFVCAVVPMSSLPHQRRMKGMPSVGIDGSSPASEMARDACPTLPFPHVLLNTVHDCQYLHLCFFACKLLRLALSRAWRRAPKGARTARPLSSVHANCLTRRVLRRRTTATYIAVVTKITQGQA